MSPKLSSLYANMMLFWRWRVFFFVSVCVLGVPFQYCTAQIGFLHIGYGVNHTGFRTACVYPSQSITV